MSEVGGDVVIGEIIHVATLSTMLNHYLKVNLYVNDNGVMIVVVFIIIFLIIAVIDVIVPLHINVNFSHLH